MIEHLADGLADHLQFAATSRASSTIGRRKSYD
jgi:hypothetical protein